MNKWEVDEHKQWSEKTRSHRSYPHSIGLFFFLFLSDEGPTLETLDYAIRIGSTPTFLHFDLY